MKPRTKLETKIVELSSTLPPLSDTQRVWAIKNVYSGLGYRATAQKIWCSCCGLIIDLPNNKKEQTCHYCGAKLTIEEKRKRVERYKDYFTILTTCKGFQVVRQFVIERSVKKGSLPSVEIWEVIQNWIDAKGKEIIMARPTTMSYNWYDLWDYSKPLSIKKCKQSSSYYVNKYEEKAKFIYPVKRIIPRLKTHGYLGKDVNLPLNELFKLLLSDHEAECLMKNKQFSLLRYKWSRGCGEYRLPFQHSIRIATKHKYIIEDASMWLDYLEALDALGIDIHNPKYVCPKDLTSAHDYYMAKKKKLQEKLDKQRRIEQTKRNEADYLNAKSKFFGICFGNDNIVITAIKSVAEMMEEGDVMHHCVFHGGYYKKDDSLILSAKDKTGKRIETIEVNLKTYKVVQSRGVCNQNTPHHEEILRLMEKNMNKIIEVA